MNNINEQKFKMIKKYGIYWLMNASEHGGAKQMVIDSKADDTIIICENYNSYAEVTPAQFIELLKINRNLFEVCCTYPQKLYFDIDIDQLDKKENDLEDTLESIKLYFPDASDYAISGSETIKKNSYH